MVEVEEQDEELEVVVHLEKKRENKIPIMLYVLLYC